MLPVAERYLQTATDVLRMLVVFSGGDASLAAEPGWMFVRPGDTLERWRGPTRTRLADAGRLGTRAAGIRRYDRRDDETAEAFAARIDRGQHDGDADLPLDRPVLAALFAGVIAFPADSESYVLFPEVTHGSVAAADGLA